MGNQDALWYLTGAAIASLGFGLAYGVGHGLAAAGLFLVFVGVFAKWE